MIIINESTNIILKPINEETNEITISSYDKDGKEHSTTIVCSGSETWEGLEEIPVEYNEPFNLEKTVAKLNYDSYRRYKDWINKLMKDAKVIYELPIINEPISINVTYEDDLNKPKKKNNQNWKKDKFWK